MVAFLLCVGTLAKTARKPRGEEAAREEAEAKDEWTQKGNAETRTETSVSLSSGRAALDGRVSAGAEPEGDEGRQADEAQDGDANGEKEGKEGIQLQRSLWTA